MKIFNRLRTNHGFTLIELLLSSVFLSFLLIIAVSGFLQINRQFIRGITVKRVQETGRLVTEELARAIRGAGDSNLITICPDPVTGNPCPAAAGDPDIKRLCIGETHYAWTYPYEASPEQLQFSRANKKVNFNFLRIDGVTQACGTTVDQDKSSSFVFKDNVTNFVDRTLQIQYLKITPVPGASGAFQIDLVLSSNTYDPLTGVSDLLASEGENAACNPAQAGAQYCDVVRFRTTAIVRQ